MKTQIRAGAELDLLTQEEMRTVLEEVVSGYLRPPERIRHPGGMALDGAGAAKGKGIYRVEPGMEFVLTRIEFIPDGYTLAAPWNPGGGGAIDIYVDKQWRDGVQFGGSSGFVLPVVYVESQSKAIVLQDGQQLEVTVTGGPASVGLGVAVCGFRQPLTPVL